MPDDQVASKLKALCVDPAALCWVEAHSGLAAWLAAIGTLAALAVTLHVMRRTIRIMQATTDQMAMEARAREAREWRTVAEAERDRASILHARWMSRARSLLATVELWNSSARDEETLVVYRKVSRDRFGADVRDSIVAFTASYEDQLVDSDARQCADLMASFTGLFCACLGGLVVGDLSAARAAKLYETMEEAKADAFTAYKQLREFLRYVDAFNDAKVAGREPPSRPVLPLWKPTEENLAMAWKLVAD